MAKPSMSGSHKQAVQQRTSTIRLREVWNRWQPERPELLIRLLPLKRVTTHVAR